MSDNLLELKNITMKFGGVTALNEVNLHVKKGEIAASYDRTQFIQKRHEVMQQWADYLDGIKAGGKVINIKRA